MLSELRLFHVIDFISQSKALSNCDLLILWNRQKVPCLVNALQNGTLSIEKLFIFAYGWVDVFCIGYTLWQSLGEKHSESFHWTLYCYCMIFFFNRKPTATRLKWIHRSNFSSDNLLVFINKNHIFVQFTNISGCKSWMSWKYTLQTFELKKIVAKKSGKKIDINRLWNVNSWNKWTGLIIIQPLMEYPCIRSSTAKWAELIDALTRYQVHPTIPNNVVQTQWFSHVKPFSPCNVHWLTSNVFTKKIRILLSLKDERNVWLTMSWNRMHKFF